MRIIAIFILALLSSELLAQKPESSVALTTSGKDGDILLRWAPTSPLLWFYANQYGYSIERFTFKRAGELLETPEKRILESSIKPNPLEDWEELARQDDYAAVAAQCIYGESLELTQGSNDIFTIANKAKELKSRFSFALLSADQNIEVAKLSGLFYQDNTAKENEYYLYRIFANVPDSIQTADTAAVYFGLPDFKGLPKPQILDIQVEDEQVLIAWNTIAFDKIYNYYQVERSKDSLNFKTLNGLPIVNVESGPRKNKTTGVYVDTTAQVGDYYYRVKARNAFGQMSPPSEAVKVKVLPRNELPQPQIFSGENVDNSSVRLEWKLPYQTESIKKISLRRAKSAKGPYEKIQEVGLSENLLIDSRPKLNNYYKIVVEDDYYRKESFPYYVQLVDSIPPAPSQIIRATVKDSVVSLSWKANNAKDLAGYRIYRSNFENSEPFLLNGDQLITDTLYREVISLKNLTKHFYYYLAAIDHVDNQSALSDAVEIEKPDVIPPTLPVITKIESRNDSVKIKWTKSSSRDVKNYLLYRKDLDLYKLVAVVPPSSDNFQEAIELKGRQTLFYRILVVDSADNEAFTAPVSVMYIPNAEKEVIQISIVELDEGLEIFWDAPAESNKSKANIYLKNESNYNLIRVVSFADGYALVDKRMKKEDIKVIFQ